jgi:hypothetical protein
VIAVEPASGKMYLFPGEVGYDALAGANLEIKAINATTTGGTIELGGLSTTSTQFGVREVVFDASGNVVAKSAIVKINLRG